MNLLKNAGMGFIQVLISAVLIFWLYRYLFLTAGPSQIGVYSILIAITAISRIGEMGITGSVVKYVAKYHSLANNINAAKIAQTAIITVGGILLVILLIGYPLFKWILSIYMPGEGRELADQLLPFCMLVFWLSIILGLMQAALDGIQKAYLRHYFLIVANTVYVGAAYFFIKDYNLIGAIYGQLIGVTVNLILVFVALKKEISCFPILNALWDKKSFKELVGYGMRFQLITLLVMLGDPLIKMLMGQFGGLSFVGFYEMSNKLVMQLRAMLVAPMQSLIPHSANLIETAPKQIPEIYLKSFSAVFFVVIVCWMPIYTMLPYISELWLGSYQPQFMLISAMLLTGVSVNLLINPAYFIYMGIGKLKWNTYVHVLTAVLSIVLGGLLGMLLGGLGVVIAWVIAFGLSGMVALVAFHHDYHIKYSALLPKDTLILLLMSIVTIVSGLSLYYGVSSFILPIKIALTAIGWVSLMGFPIWNHSVCKKSFSKLIKSVI